MMMKKERWLLLNKEKIRFKWRTSTLIRLMHSRVTLAIPDLSMMRDYHKWLRSNFQTEEEPLLGTNLKL